MESRSCTHAPPIDVLNQIFELVIETCLVPRIVSIGTTTPHEKQKQAIALASISRAWRAAALQTPRLWNTISISLDWDTYMVKEYWAWTVRRVKGVPVSLLIYDICEESRVRLEDLNGSSMRFKEMRLHLKHPGDAVLFPESWRDYDIDTLRVDIYRQYSGRHGPHKSATPVELGHFVENVRRFELEGWDATPARIADISSTRLFQLHLFSIRDIDIAGVLRSFPCLESLYFAGCGFRPLSSVSVATETRTLDVRNNKDDEWLSKVKFPKLQRISYDDTYSTSLEEFLKAHSTIETIRLRVSSDVEFTRFLQLAAQITTLHIVLSGYVAWGGCIASQGAFPVLKRLGVSEWVNDIEPGQLGAVIKARCLPLHHPLSTATDSSRLLEEFCIEVGRTALCETVDVYQEATKRIVEIGPLRTKIYLSWPTEQE